MEYMSREGYEKLSSELNELIKERLPEAIDAISEARDKGDLSENFEYRAARREQSRLLGRIRFLQRVLSHARVMPDSEQPLDRVRLLTKVALTNLSTNKKMTYTIVSPHEANAKELKISVKSPIAQALMNHKVGEVVNVSVPVGIIRLRIETIERG
jgi:transcription elongation factor GreA